MISQVVNYPQYTDIILDNKDKLIEFSLGLCKKSFKLLQVMIHGMEKYGVYEPSQGGKLSELSGASRRHVNRMVKEFCKLGLITKTYRHNETCIYRWGKVLEDKEMRDTLRYLKARKKDVPKKCLTGVSLLDINIKNKEHLLDKDMKIAVKKWGITRTIGLYIFPEEIRHRAFRSCVGCKEAAKAKDSLAYLFTVCWNLVKRHNATMQYHEKHRMIDLLLA